MVLQEIKNDLFTWFGSHDTFSMEENFDALSELNILISKADKPLTQGLIEKALEEYEARKVVVMVAGAEGKKFWVLNEPLERYAQTIELTYPTLSSLTKLVNDYCDQTKNQGSKVNPLNVREADIQSLILIVHEILNPQGTE